jgi:hypothetical protein
MIGAAAYFFGSAETGRDYALAAPKAAFWPALLVYKLLKSLYPYCHPHRHGGHGHATDPPDDPL